MIDPQVLNVRMRLLASAHHDLIEQCIATHGWARIDIVAALAHVGSWQRLDEMFKDYQRTGRVPWATTDPDMGKERGRQFYGWVLGNYKRYL